MTDISTNSQLRTATRDVAIDSLRGVAIILMVAGHIIGGNEADGMQVASDSAWRHSYELLVDIRMPLFTALSGFVYGRRPLRGTAGYGRFAWGKTRRLLVPLFTVGTLFVLLQSLTPGTNSDRVFSDVWMVYVYGDGQFWFLQSLFLIFLVVGIADALGWLRDQRILIGAVVATALLSSVARVPEVWDVFAVNGFFRLLPFFLLGYWFSVRGRRADRGARWVVLLIAVALFAARAAVVLDWVAVPDAVNAALSIALGIAAISALLAFREALGWRPLAWLGYFSFAIYLLNVFGTAPARMLLTHAGIESPELIFLACLVAGLALPVLFEVTAGRIAWVSWTFLGQRPYRPPTWSPRR